MALVIPTLWLLKSFVYWWVFRFRTIRATALNCLLIAGAPFFLSIVPLPSVLAFPAAVGLAIYMTMHYTGVELIPDGLLIPLAAEIAFWAVQWGIQVSGILT
jgi:hypothetical protein